MLGIFDKWKSSKTQSPEGDTAGPGSGKNRTDTVKGEDPALSEASPLTEQEISIFRKAASLKEHHYRAGVINFMDVVCDDLKSVNEINFRPAMNMIIATIAQFIEAEKETNRKLLDEIKACK